MTTALTTFRLAGTPPAKLITSERQLQKHVAKAHTGGQRLVILGGGSNVLLPANMAATVLQLTDSGQRVCPASSDRTLRLWAGDSVARIAWTLLRIGYIDLADFVGLPGSFGGGVWNSSHGRAGRLLNESVAQIRFLDLNDGKFKTHDLKSSDFAYDWSRWQSQAVIITGVTLHLSAPVGDNQQKEILAQAQEYSKYKARTQPLDASSAGCFWRNVPNNDYLRQRFAQFRDRELFPSAVLIQVVADGLCVGGARVSERHRSFIINNGQATHRDVLALAREIKHRVSTEFGVLLQPEVTIFDKTGKKVQL